jgi:hypothetical protein
VSEESHLDEMRNAIRGDFERLAERRGDQELMRLNVQDVPDPHGDELNPESPRRSWLARLVSP